MTTVLSALILTVLGQSSDDPAKTSASSVSRGPFRSVQVNVDGLGANLQGDAANSPSLAVNPKDPKNLVIGWQHFGSVRSNFRQAGWAYSLDGGASWKPGGILQSGAFRSHPNLQADSNGTFYYLSQSSRSSTELFRSSDGGKSWKGPEWSADRECYSIVTGATIPALRGRCYYLCDNHIIRSTQDKVGAIEPLRLPVDVDVPTIALARDGAVLVAGMIKGRIGVLRMPRGAEFKPSSFVRIGSVDLVGKPTKNAGPNPGGSLGRLQLAANPAGPEMYILGSVAPTTPDPLEVKFARSTDGGHTWSPAVRVNDDAKDSGAWQWFGTMSVAPNGRIDALWNDTRSVKKDSVSRLFYAYSTDGGITWSKNIPVTPPFNSYVGWPQKNSIGSGMSAVSDDEGVSVAFAATFNREQDVYFLRIEQKSLKDK
ncbi:MAG: exo-alpha-sialidase [Phycisphaerales bacterium]|nr:MAG: exo-alpha-sialidase [Phycisphaerales bacterium]